MSNKVLKHLHYSFFLHTPPFPPKKATCESHNQKKAAEGEGMQISCNFQALLVGVDTTLWAADLVKRSKRTSQGPQGWNQKKGTVQQLPGTPNPSSESLYFARCEPLLVLKLVIFGDFLPWEFERHEVLTSSWEDEEPSLFRCFLDFNQVRVLRCIRSFAFKMQVVLIKKPNKNKLPKHMRFVWACFTFNLRDEKWLMMFESFWGD